MMMDILLGSLIQIDLREKFYTEDGDFTPWLAKEENLKLLAETIGIELELEEKEKDVGPFRADLLCKSIEDDSWVLIENQIERTDHKHLGQLLTYAAGLEAVTIVWIASKFTEEHSKAIEWLNQITDEKFRFFALEVELWKINDSLPAPKFNIISKPNYWGKRVKQAAKEIEDNVNTPTRELRVRYWTALAAFLSSKNSKIKVSHNKPINWQDFRLGRTNAFIRVSMGTREGYLKSGVHLKGKMRGLYNNLVLEKERIQNELGFSLDWRDDPYPILNAKMDSDISNEQEWYNQFVWIENTLEKFLSVFSATVKAFDPYSDIDEESES